MVSHLNKNNSPTMVDVGDKNITLRIAEAEGEVIFDKNSFKKIESLKSKKGSIINVAILAGIMGAKETSKLIPLCHNIPIDAVNVEIVKNIIAKWVPGTYNISSNLLRNGQVLQKVYPKFFEVVNKLGPTGKPRGLLDSSKLNQLGWNFKIKLKEGITQTYFSFND